jgi:Protein of unknown function (DUF998)
MVSELFTFVTAGRTRSRSWTRRVARASPVGSGAYRWVLIDTALLPVVIVAAWTVAQTRQPHGFNAIRQSVSVLAGYGASDRWIVTAALYVAGAGYLLAASGLAQIGIPAQIGLLVSGVAGLGIAVFPEPAVGSTPPHLAFTALGAIALAIWPALVAAGPAVRERGLMSRRALLAVASGFSALLLWTFVETQFGSALGLAERVSSALPMCWPFVVAWALAPSRLSVSSPDRELVTSSPIPKRH